MSKQRLKLDSDDVLAPGFITAPNSENLIEGLNENGTTPLDVNVGGLGNTTFAPDQTLVFNGKKIVSSGVSPNVAAPTDYDDRYYTKTEMDAFFGETVDGKKQVDWSNITNQPSLGLKLQFLAPAVVLYDPTGTVPVDNTPHVATVTGVAGQTLVAALISVSGYSDGPNNVGPSKLQVRAHGTTAWIETGWFRAAATGDSTAGGCHAVVPLDVNAQFDFQLAEQYMTNAELKIVLLAYWYI